MASVAGDDPRCPPPRRLSYGLARLLVWSVLLLGAATPFTALGQDDAATVLERRVKAALLYRFINYVDWDETVHLKPDAPFTIAITGADALAQELSEVAAGRTALNRPLVIRRVRAQDIPRDAQVVFIGRREASQMAALIRSIPPNILIVTESDDALTHGSIINFVIADGQVRFDVALDAARRRNIHLSSRLLSVARSLVGAVP